MIILRRFQRKGSWRCHRLTRFIRHLRSARFPLRGAANRKEEVERSSETPDDIRLKKNETTVAEAGGGRSFILPAVSTGGGGGFISAFEFPLPWTRCRINEKRKRRKRLKSESPEAQSRAESRLSEQAYSRGNLGNRTNAMKYVARVIALGFGAIKDNRHLENRTLLNVAMAKLARSNGPDPKINTL